MVENWQDFLFPYQQAVNELKVKLRGMRKQFEEQAQHSPIEFVTGRVKPVDSIKEKMVRRHVQADRLEQDMQDIAGLRIMCQCGCRFAAPTQRYDDFRGTRLRYQRQTQWLPVLPHCD